MSVISLDNIHSYLNENTISDESSELLCEKISMLKNEDLDIGHIECIFECISHYINVLRQNPSLSIVVKALFHEFIESKNITSIIKYYNRIFNDNLYKQKNTEYKNIEYKNTLSDEEIQYYLNKYNESINFSYEVSNTPIIYEENEIIGAKDRNGKWWMARILKIFSHRIKNTMHNLYYIEYCGWGSSFNEFILHSDSHRMQKFNPKKHILYRSAWKK